MTGPAVLYRVSAWRTTNGRRERVTHLRRQWPAARRLAEQLEERGQGPVTIQYAIATWREVPQ